MNRFVFGFAAIVGCLLVASSCSSKSDGDPRSASGAGVGGSAAATAGSGGNTTSAGGNVAAGSSSAPNGGATANGGATFGGGRPASGGTPSVAGGATAGSPTAGGGAGGAVGNADSPCDDLGLVWKSANKTNYESYPDPGSEECIEFNGCTWAGQFAGCDGKKPEAWVKAHDIVAAFPDFDSLELHDLCLRKGDKTIVVTVLDTCGDSDCDGCCTENKGNAEQLIDVEKYTNQRWGVSDGRIEWADLGPTRGSGCD